MLNSTFIPKETFKPEAAFRLIKSKQLLNLCSLFLHQGVSFKKFEVDEVRIEHDKIQWFSKPIRFNPSGMVRLVDDRGIVVAQKILTSLAILTRGDSIQFIYHLYFTPRLLEYETLPKEVIIDCQL